MARNGTLDHARLIAAFGIVFFHTGAPGAAFGYAALPFFLIVLTVLTVPAATRSSFGTYAAARARRLLIPWLIWSAIYGAMKLAELAVTGAPFASEFAPYMLLTGPALHLWFLPFAFSVCLAAYPLIRLAWPPLCPVLVAGGLSALLVLQYQTLPAPFAQWLYALPAVLLGLGLALSQGRQALQALLIGGFFTGALALGATVGLAQLILAVAAFILCNALPLPSTAASRLAGTAALGVYLAHPLVLSVLGRLTPLAPDSTMMALLGCAGALAIALSLPLSANIKRKGMLWARPLRMTS